MPSRPVLRRRFASVRAALIAGVLGACAVVSPVEWEDPRVLEGADSAAVLVIQPTGAPALVDAPDIPAWRPAGACPGSVSFAGRDAERYAVWWNARTDGSVALLGARSEDGGVTWSAPVVVDTADRSDDGCRRPPPALAVDQRSGYVHAAYFLHGPDGPGVFFAHSMERAVLFHPPIQIVYGERPSRVAIAADGGMVAVAFQDPNTAAPRIAVAISRTDGHIFEHRIHGVSAEHVSAQEPRVGVRGRTVAVGWNELPRTRSDDAAGVTVVRMGVARD